MPTFLAKLLTWFLDRLRGKTPPPSRIEVVAREAAQAETKLQSVETANVDVARANQARADAAAAVVNHPDGVYDDDGFKRPG